MCVAGRTAGVKRTSPAGNLPRIDQLPENVFPKSTCFTPRERWRSPPGQQNVECRQHNPSTGAFHRELNPGKRRNCQTWRDARSNTWPTSRNTAARAAGPSVSGLHQPESKNASVTGTPVGPSIPDEVAPPQFLFRIDSFSSSSLYPDRHTPVQMWAFFDPKNFT